MIWYQCKLCRYRITEKQYKQSKFNRCPRCGVWIDGFEIVEDKIDYNDVSIYIIDYNKK